MRLLRWLGLGRTQIVPDRSSPLRPVDRMLSLLLAQAEAGPFSAIIIGAARLPGWNPEKIAEMMNDWDSRPLSALPERSHDRPHNLAQEAHNSSARLRHALGWKSVPVFGKAEGQFCSLTPIPVGAYLCCLSTLESRLLSLDGSPESPKPARYIEYTLAESLPADSVSRVKSGERKFAEVDLVLSDDNSVWINIRSFRTEPQSVHASAGYY